MPLCNTVSPASCDVTTAAHWSSVVVAPLSTACSGCGGREGNGGGGGGRRRGHVGMVYKRRQEERKDVKSDGEKEKRKA